MKNRFGWKLTLSIIEILCIIPPISICGIVSCVFTAKANTAYLEGNFEDYRKQAHASTITLFIGLAFIFLAGMTLGKAILTDVVIQTSVEVKTEREIDKRSSVPLEDTLLKDYHTFTLIGETIKLPMTLDELQELGFIVEDGDRLSRMINSDQSGYLNLYLSEDRLGRIGQIYLYNNENKAKPLEDCLVMSFEITSDLYPLDQDDLVYMEVVNGFTFDSTKEDLLAYFGEPDKEYMNKEHNSGYYTWYAPSYEQNLQDQITFYFNGAKLSKITVAYTGAMPRLEKK